ncbi:MAG TPA: two-component sensor histidine kinase [Gordonia polyisoprenivorans]|nr:two-component sensor histidine kinase [Gordonia polyisoprenivorans]
MQPSIAKDVPGGDSPRAAAECSDRPRPDFAPGAASGARPLVVAYLGSLLISKLADANQHPDLRYMPVVALCFVLPFWYASGWARAPWRRWGRCLLLGQAAVTYLGFALFGDHWVGGVSGLLGALVLLVVRPPWRWWVFGAVAAGELALWLVVGLPYRPAVNAAGWLLIVFGNVSLGVFGLTRLSELVEGLAATREALAEAAVTAQRVAAATDVRMRIMHHLGDVRAHVRKALAGAPHVERDELRQAGDAARTAAASARRIAIDLPESPAHATDRIDRTTPTLARRVVIAVVILFAGQYLLNLIVPAEGGATPSLATTLLAVSIAVVMVALQLRHSRCRPDDRRPPGWPWTLGVQAVLCFIAYPVFGVVSVVFLAFLSGSILLLIKSPLRWALFGVVVICVPILTALGPADLVGVVLQIRWSIYAASTLAAAGLLIYGLSRFSRTATELDLARRELAEAAVTAERLRIAQDTHDTLGLGLSTIALKSDLAQTLLDRDEPRARREIVQMLHLARTVTSDASALVNGTLRLELDDELATARDVLTTSDVVTTIACATVSAGADVESEVAAILRESVTNVLRHSTARECRIQLACQEGWLSLRVVNDGASCVGEVTRGQGLTNIAARATRLGGSVSARVEDDRFTLVAGVPVGTGAGE